MTKNNWQTDPAAEAEAEDFYSFVGRYIICFQWIEGKIDEIILLAKGFDARRHTAEWLARRTFAQKAESFFKMARSDEAFHPCPVPGWLDRLILLEKRIDEERERRNGLLHANYLFDFLAIGQPIIRSHLKRRDGDFVFDQETLTSDRRDAIMQELAMLAFDFNMACVQLRHLWRDPKERPLI